MHSPRMHIINFVLKMSWYFCFYRVLTAKPPVPDDDDIWSLLNQELHVSKKTANGHRDIAGSDMSGSSPQITDIKTSSPNNGTYPAATFAEPSLASSVEDANERYDSTTLRKKHSWEMSPIRRGNYIIEKPKLENPPVVIRRNEITLVGHQMSSVSSVSSGHDSAVGEGGSHLEHGTRGAWNYENNRKMPDVSHYDDRGSLDISRVAEVPESNSLTRFRKDGARPIYSSTIQSKGRTKKGNMEISRNLIKNRMTPIDPAHGTKDNTTNSHAEDKRKKKNRRNKRKKIKETREGKKSPQNAG
ncbi:uncharacterized protein LOC106014241 [Aplysia californica]|uniref:Uncharacterized protein LOC106014241 n=1 Tax=Aplysia californica TaxID=6500 RepID=A0ABM1AG46_APLCA|nr:uncharacterized protein LOC106014241 [Aplysia californica]